MSRKGLIAILGSTVVVLAVALPVASGASRATSVNVTAGKPAELRFTLSKKSAAKGAVTFKVVNKGVLEHDFKIAGKVTKKLNAGQSATLKVTFKKAGKYPFICTLPGHAAGGMKGVFVVT